MKTDMVKYYYKDPDTGVDANYDKLYKSLEED